jgi:hypothetical protein
MNHYSVRHFMRPRWFVIAAVARTLLNLVNQYQALLFDVGLIDWPKLALTYVVPYFVSSLSAWFEPSA